MTDEKKVTRTFIEFGHRFAVANEMKERASRQELDGKTYQQIADAMNEQFFEKYGRNLTRWHVRQIADELGIEWLKPATTPGGEAPVALKREIEGLQLALTVTRSEAAGLQSTVARLEKAVASLDDDCTEWVRQNKSLEVKLEAQSHLIQKHETRIKRLEAMMGVANVAEPGRQKDRQGVTT